VIIERSSASDASSSIPTDLSIHFANSFALVLAFDVITDSGLSSISVISITDSFTLDTPCSVFVKRANCVCLSFTFTVDTTLPSWGAVLNCCVSSRVSSTPTFLSTDFANSVMLVCSFLTIALFTEVNSSLIPETVSPISWTPTVLSIDLTLFFSFFASDLGSIFSSNLDVYPLTNSSVWSISVLIPCVVSFLMTVFDFFPSFPTVIVFSSGFTKSRSSISIGASSIPTDFPTNDASSCAFDFSFDIDAEYLAVSTSVISVKPSGKLVIPRLFSVIIAWPVYFGFMVSVETTLPSWGAVLKVATSSTFSSRPKFLSTDVALSVIFVCSFFMHAIVCGALSSLNSDTTSPTSVNPTLLSIDFALLLSFFPCATGSTFSSSLDVNPLTKSSVLSYAGFMPWETSILITFFDVLCSFPTVIVFVSGVTGSMSSRSICSSSIPTDLPTNDASLSAFDFSFEVEADCSLVSPCVSSVKASSTLLIPSFFSVLTAIPLGLDFTVSVDITLPSWGAVLKVSASSIFSSIPTFFSTDFALSVILVCSFLTITLACNGLSSFISDEISPTSVNPTVLSMDFALFLSFFSSALGSMLSSRFDVNPLTRSSAWS